MWLYYDFAFVSRVVSELRNMICGVIVELTEKADQASLCRLPLVHMETSTGALPLICGPHAFLSRPHSPPRPAACIEYQWIKIIGYIAPVMKKLLKRHKADTSTSASNKVK